METIIEVIEKAIKEAEFDMNYHSEKLKQSADRLEKLTTEFEELRGKYVK